jgi:hypothetical protein
MSVSSGSLACDGCTTILYDSSMSISSGSVSCIGCTTVFTGSSKNTLGTLSITGGTINMSAASTVTSKYLDANYNGVLFYMDNAYPEPSNACGSAPVSIQGSSTVALNGGMYFPNASVCVTGNAFSGTESCLSLVAWSITYTGNATENLTGCSAIGTKTATNNVVTLVQ